MLAGSNTRVTKREVRKNLLRKNLLRKNRAETPF